MNQAPATTPQREQLQASLSFDVAGLRAMIQEEVRTALASFTPPTSESTALRYYTREEAGQLLHVSQTTLTKWRQAGTLIPVKIGGRTLYPSEAITKALRGMNRKR